MRFFGQGRPFGEGAGICAMEPGLVMIVDIVPDGSGAGLAVVAEQFLQLLEQVCFRTEMAEMLVAALGLLSHLRAHLNTIVAVEGVALDIGGGELLAAEDVFKRLLYPGRAGPGRSGN